MLITTADESVSQPSLFVAWLQNNFGYTPSYSVASKETSTKKFAPSLELLMVPMGSVTFRLKKQWSNNSRKDLLNDRLEVLVSGSFISVEDPRSGVNPEINEKWSGVLRQEYGGPADLESTILKRHI